ncbi:MAG TPA: cytochrome c [Stellaceae bacterium]|nr:cytochrome c [Stellaceae bacterium]
MRTLRKVAALGAVLAVAALLSTGAPAADKEQVIKDREALMKHQGADMGAIKGFLDDKADQAKAAEGATNLVGDVHKIPDVFPEGTGGASPDGKHTTKPEIWSDWKAFLAARDAAEEKAKALAAAVKTGDKEKIQTAFADMGKNGCGGCHGKFREDIKK